jgi:hypothetical protein
LLGPVGYRDRHLVGQRQRLEHRAQLVKAVLTRLADGEVQVDLRRHANGDRWWYDSEHT